MDWYRWVVGAVVVLLVVAFFALDVGRYFDLSYLEEQRSALLDMAARRPIATASAFFSLYVLVAALSVPGAAILTLAAGAIFGLVWGVVLVSFASTLGATLAFAISRFLFRGAVQQRFGRHLGPINSGIEREGGFYLFTLRLVPLFPFFVINLVMGLTPLRIWPFYWVSQLGMLPGTIVYVNAGTELAKLGAGTGILTPGLIAAFTLLGVFPLLAKHLVAAVRRARVLRGYKRPKRFDRNLVVIGAGSAGLVSAYIAATVRASVSLIERTAMGGDCLNTGCVPSKALIRSTRFLAAAKDAQRLGIRSVTVDFDFAEVMSRVRRVVGAIAPHDSVERYSALGVDCISGEARILSPYEVEVGDKVLTTRNIVIATGARPLVPPIPGLTDVDFVTSDSVWELDVLPKRLAVLGGGPIGCELAQCFARLGSDVTIIDMARSLLPREDPDISQLVMDRFEEGGIALQMRTTVERVEGRGAAGRLLCNSDGVELEVRFDHLLLAVGRRPVTDGLGLQALGIEPEPSGSLWVDEYQRTRIPTIFACGDVVGPYQFTHMAAHQAWFATVNALFGRFKKFKTDYSVVPWCTFTDPEVARVGLSEEEAVEKEIPFEVSRYDISDLDRAIADETAYGIVKVLTVPGKDRILGACIVAEHAGDLIAEFVTAIRRGIGLGKILGTIHVYPTLAEANKYVAGSWKRNHAPERLLEWVRRYHVWQRG
jgi:pyruvate/2-oxoglutarate dehydrogenase complex dihydrolipoamide dehydrogenase (E3) component/uncharacterized membrane protein YdjX (TVP38/TMEM64 family)